LRKALTSNGFKVDGTGRSFAPHVTMVRKVPPACQLEAGQEIPMPALAWPCQRFFLVRSRLSSAGSEYLILRAFALD
jgi:RNA 2',3'-cyclic 3'-phosphodiesterase